MLVSMSSMGRPHRIQAGGFVYHVLNRANSRNQMFADDGDYAAFLRALADAQAEHPMRLLAYCVMPNHWHLVLWPEHDGTLSPFVGWLTLTHTQRWHAYRRTAGNGHLYQGRFKKAPAMFKSAPAGAFNKRGRTHAVNDPHLLGADLDPLHQCSYDFAPSVPVSFF